MVEWRERGYVQDSDDEDVISSEEDLDFKADENGTAKENGTSKLISLEGDIITSARTGCHPEGPVVDNTVTRRNDGFQDIDELQLDHVRSPSSSVPTTPTYARHAHKAQDVFDVPSTLSGTEERCNSVAEDSKSQVETGIPASTSLPHATIPSARIITQHENSVTEVLQTEGDSNRRTFRQRNPIQIHPYLLESEQYRQTLRARGLRPVVVTSIDRRLEHDIAQDSQSAEQETQLSSQSYQSSFHEVIKSPKTLTRNPGVSTILSVHTTALHEDGLDANRSVKRRKLAHINRPGVPWSAVIERERQNGLGREDDIYDLPTSPLALHDQNENDDFWPKLKKFRLPGARPLTYLPTPLPSSDVDRLEASSELSDEDLTDSLPRTRSRPRRVSTLRSVQSSSSTSDEEPAQTDLALKSATRRIKGVLPASWLRLDQQRQAQKFKAPVPAETPHVPSLVRQRGVAQRMRRRSSHVERCGHTSLSPDCGSSVFRLDSPTSGIGSAQKPSEFANALSLLRDAGGEELEEEDWIDPMVSTATRSHRNYTTKKRQIRLADAFDRQKSDARTVVPAKQDFYSTGNIQKKRRMKTSSAPRMSILDSVASQTFKTLPDFLRVGVRRARGRADQGRHSPARKQISFHSHKDNQRNQKQLKDWRTGRMQSYRKPQQLLASNPMPIRKPLAEQAHNRQGTFSSPVKIFDIASNTSLTESSGREQDRSVIDKPKKLQQSTISDAFSSFQDVKIAPKLASQAPRTARKTSSLVREIWTSTLNRPGQLEVLEEIFAQENPETHFQEQLAELDTDFVHRHGHGTTRAKTQSMNMVPPRTLISRTHVGPTVVKEAQIGAHSTFASGARTRTRPQRAYVDDVDAVRLGFENFFPSEAIDTTSSAVTADNSIFTGLDPSGSLYTVDFGVQPCSHGVFFHSDTFLGSGAFQDALQTGTIGDERTQGVVSFQCQNKTVIWRSWTDKVGSEFDETVHAALESHFQIKLDSDLSSSALSMMKSIVKYLATTVNFDSRDDRSRCLTRISTTLKMAFEEKPLALRNPLPAFVASPENAKRHTELVTYFSVVAYQASKLAEHPSVSTVQRNTIMSVFHIAVNTLIHALFEYGMHILYQDLQGTKNTPCIRSEQAYATAAVVLNHLLLASGSGLSLANLISSILQERKTNTFSDVSAFEKSWRDVFTILPFLEFDSNGLFRRGPRSEAIFENWDFVKSLMARTFDLYNQSDCWHAPKLNGYIRTTLSRCFTLAKVWNWKHSDLILGCIFDFFAQRQFSFLPSEGSKNSPAFLAHLDSVTCSTLTLEPSDRSLDIFLKFLGLGIHEWAELYPQRKLKNIIWRLMPNHGRRHARETELVEHELDTLRNQHNLLCVLYWAAPPNLRIDVKKFRDLVDIKQSHSAVVRLNIRSWTNLARFQLSITEDGGAIALLAEWFNSFIIELISLHRDARLEAEANSSAANLAGNYISRKSLEAVITKNERQVEGLLTMVLASMVSLLENTTNLVMARFMFQKLGLLRIFALFDPRKPRFGTHVSLALEAYQAYFRLLLPRPASSSLEQNSDESQDYGEWSSIEELGSAGNIGGEGASANLDMDMAFSEVHQILSNTFGADGFSDDILLSKLVDTWVCCCCTVVSLTDSTWSHYIDRHSSRTWSQLRDTPQTRAYTPYFLAKVLVSNSSAYTENSVVFYNAWLGSLVDIEPVLKYQHMLTNALLNTHPEHTLLRNLPISRSSELNDFSVSLDDLRRRRIAIISSIFANMRNAVEVANSESPFAAQEKRQEYSAIVKHVMNEMRRCYEETQQGSTVRKAYVEFVQSIVELIQQFPRTLISIDRFFTDSATFPLPVADPTYVVGRLRGYQSRLSDEASQKELSTFLRNLCERAVVEAQQSYLVDQLIKSVQGSSGGSHGRQASLGIVLLGALFPCYIDQVFSPCGWILSLPILQASTTMFVNLFYSLDKKDDDTIRDLRCVVTRFLRPIRKALTHICNESRALLGEAHVLSACGVMYSAATSILPLVEFLDMDATQISEAASHLMTLRDFGMRLTDETNPLDLTMPLLTSHEDVGSEFQGVIRYCTAELKESLDGNWEKYGEEYYVSRGSIRRDVIVDIESAEKETERLMLCVEQYLEVFGRMRGLMERV